MTKSSKAFIEEILKLLDHWERAAKLAPSAPHQKDEPFQVDYSSISRPGLATASDLHFEEPEDPTSETK